LGFVLEQPARHLEPRQTGHLHIQKDDVRLHAVDHAERLGAAAGLPGDLHAACLPEQVAELVTRELLIVHDDRLERHYAITRSGTISSGISICADVPWPEMLRSFS